MSTLLGATALFVALGALWLTSELIKRYDGQIAAAIKPHIQAFNAAIAENRRQMRTLEERLRSLEAELRAAGEPATSAPPIPADDPWAAPRVAAQERRSFAPSEFADA
jgi:hypothetical protein